MDTPLHSKGKETVKTVIFEGERASKKVKTVKSASNVMATSFWDARGIFHTHYVKKEPTITGAYHASLLYRLSEKKTRNNVLNSKIKRFSSIKTMHGCTSAQF